MHPGHLSYWPDDLAAFGKLLPAGVALALERGSSLSSLTVWDSPTVRRSTILELFLPRGDRISIEALQ